MCLNLKMSTDILFQIFRVQTLQFRNYENAVFPDEHVVELDFSAAVFGTLDHYEVPVNG